jgi:tRNA (mo5U34)-methyltransferase
MKWKVLFEQVPQLQAAADAISARFDESAHGDFARWQAALDALPEIQVSSSELGDNVTVAGDADQAQASLLRTALMELHPWRKGPFNLFGVEIDCEWRSDWKWQRVAPHIRQISNARILDVGSGNGYFGWRMLQQGASLVVGVDPTLLFCMQHLAINKYLNDQRNWVLPLTFEELPAAKFDIVFSMGVVYHRRKPRDHVKRLFEYTRPGGQVILESLVVTGTQSLKPAGRYARMSNVHTVPSAKKLCSWLGDAGFVDAKLVDTTQTTTREQRSTSWMRFESLEEALDPENPRLTVEGLPAPSRAVVMATRPSDGKCP